MKGINAMTAILIMLLIVLTILGWISTNQSVGSGQASQIKDRIITGESNRRLQKALLSIQSAFRMTAQRGSLKAANKSGRAGRQPEKRYWLCRNNPQPASIEATKYAASNYTKKLMKERLSELRGIRNNWYYQTGTPACINTGYNEPLNSTSNDHYQTAIKLDAVKIKNADGSIMRGKEPVVLSEKIVYNRYWYIYSNLKKWVRNNEIKENVRNRLGNVKSTFSSFRYTCKNNETLLTPRQICSSNRARLDTNNYPSPKICQGVAQDGVEKTVKAIVQDSMENLENNYFNGRVQCSFNPNKADSGARYPGIGIPSLPTSKTSTNTSRRCSESIDDLHGYIWKCKTTWRHSLKSYVDGTVNCIDNKFQSIPGNSSLKRMKWSIDISLKSSNTGNGGSPRRSCGSGSTNPPLKLQTCGIGSEKTRSCTINTDLKGELKRWR